MGAIFRITVDPSTHMVRQYLAGFFEAADVERFVEARNAAHEQLTCGPNEHVTLVDVRDMKIQPQDIVQAFGSVLADPRYRSRKLAFVFALSLARMQLLRAAAGRNARLFNNEEDAQAWLLSENDEAENPASSDEARLRIA